MYRININELIKVDNVDFFRDHDGTSVKYLAYNPHNGRTGILKENGCVLGIENEDLREKLASIILNLCGVKTANIELMQDDNGKNYCFSYNVLEDKKQSAHREVMKILEQYDDRNEIKNLLNELVFVYEQVLLKKLEINVSIQYDDVFDKTLKNDTIKDIQRKINGIILIADSLEYNVNLKLLVDKLVISMFGVD